MVTTTNEAGARTVIGFENPVYNTACNAWCDNFFKYHALYYEDSNKTIGDVCIATDGDMQCHIHYEAINEDGELVTVRNYVIVGTYAFP